jgi:alkanesulfonate monooxygenase SsuD/methylene tetrahydromethanopterin reductase-like flavin-dependent oxidoreductase (luciferase family)
LKLGVSLPVFSNDASRPLNMAVRAAELGFDGVFCPDHLLSPSPGRSRGTPALEAFSVLAAVAARELGLYVGTLVARVGLRAPGLLAKQSAALDSMSLGRAIVGLGAGDSDSRPENEAFGIPFPPVSERVGLLEETALALRRLFEGKTWPAGRWVPAMNGPLLPAASPKIWVGGLSDAVVSVAARTADAWNGWGVDEATFAAKVELLKHEAGGRRVEATWAGIVLVGEDEGDLSALIDARVAAGLPVTGIWSGTAAQLRDFGIELSSSGASWLIALPVGPPDRIQLIADSLR